MFERFTEKARRVIFFGRYEASEFGSRYIETEHLLLGILREDKALALHLFKAPGGLEGIHKEIAAHSMVGEKIPTSVDLPLSNESKRVLAYAAEEAERLADKHIAAGHLLLGLLREERCFAAVLLAKHGINLASVRELVKTFEADRTIAQPASPTPGKLSFDIAELGVDLTELALNGNLPALVGRESELEQIMQVLSRLTRGHPVLVGEMGVGKRSIVNGLAHRIVQCNVPAGLLESRIISIDFGVIASGVGSRARFEDNLDQILAQLKGGRNILLFIEGLHALAETQRFLNIANILKPALLQGGIHCISSATPKQYRQTVESVPWLEQLFTVVTVRPATQSEAVNVLQNIKGLFEGFHGVAYTDDALEYAVFHSSNYFPNRFLPEKAIDLMDEAGARTRLRQPKLPDEVLEVRKRTKLIRERHDRALDNHEFEKARFYSDELRKEQENLKTVEARFTIDRGSKLTVSRHDIDNVVAEKTGIPVESLQRSSAPGRG